MFTLAKQHKEKKPKKTEQSSDLNYESRVIELDESSFDNFNKTTIKFFVYFYGDQCKRCDKFTPKYEKSSDLSYQSEWKIPYVKVNIDKSPNLKEYYKISKVPEVFWVNHEDNDFHEYPGKLSPKAMVKFINSQLNYTSQELFNWEQLEAKKKSGRYLIFVGDIEKFKKIYERVVKVSKDEDIDVVMWSKNPDLFDKFDVKRSEFDVVLLSKKKNNIEIITNLNIHAESSVSEIERLMEIYERKAYSKLNDYSLLLSVEHNPPTPTLFLIYSQRNKTHALYNREISSVLEKLALKYRRDYHFTNVSLSTNLITPLVAVFNVTNDDIPVLLLINHNKDYADDVEKYIFPVGKKITEENVEEFLRDFKDGKLQKVIYSDPIPENITTSEGVYNLVGYNYEDFLFKNNNQKDIVLFFYSEFSYVNNEIEERLNNVVAKLKNNPNLVFARANPLFNEMRLINYDNLPSLFIIRGANYNERVKNIVQFLGQNFNVEAVTEFIKSNVNNPITNIDILQNETEIITAEKENVLVGVPKEKEEELIDFDEYNSGLRRYVRYLMDEEDDDQIEDYPEETDDDSKRKKNKNKEEL